MWFLFLLVSMYFGTVRDQHCYSNKKKLTRLHYRKTPRTSFLVSLALFFVHCKGCSYPSSPHLCFLFYPNSPPKIKMKKIVKALCFTVGSISAPTNQPTNQPTQFLLLFKSLIFFKAKYISMNSECAGLCQRLPRLPRRRPGAGGPDTPLTPLFILNCTKLWPSSPLKKAFY